MKDYSNFIDKVMSIKTIDPFTNKFFSDSLLSFLSTTLFINSKTAPKFIFFQNASEQFFLFFLNKMLRSYGRSTNFKQNVFFRNLRSNYVKMFCLIQFIKITKPLNLENSSLRTFSGFCELSLVSVTIYFFPIFGLLLGSV